MKLEKSEKSQLLVNKLFTADQVKYLNSSGIWQVSLSLKSFVNKSNETDPVTASSEELKEVQVLTREFLVLPSDTTDESGKVKRLNEQQTEEIRKFWPLKQICIESLPPINFKRRYLFDELLKPCESIYWSTRYPDPKSDVMSQNLSIDLANRIPLD